MRIQIARAVSNNVYTKRKENRSFFMYPIDLWNV